MMKFVIVLAALIATTLAAPQPQFVYTPVTSAVTYTTTNDGASAAYRVAPTTTPIRTVGYVQPSTFVYGTTDVQSAQYAVEPIAYVV